MKVSKNLISRRTSNLGKTNPSSKPLRDSPSHSSLLPHPDPNARPHPHGPLLQSPQKPSNPNPNLLYILTTKRADIKTLISNKKRTQYT